MAYSWVKNASPLQARIDINDLGTRHKEFPVVSLRPAETQAESLARATRMIYRSQYMGPTRSDNFLVVYIPEVPDVDRTYPHIVCTGQSISPERRSVTIILLADQVPTTLEEWRNVCGTREWPDGVRVTLKSARYDEIYVWLGEDDEKHNYLQAVPVPSMHCSATNED